MKQAPLFFEPVLGDPPAANVVDKRLTEKDLSPDQRTVYDTIVGWVEYAATGLRTDVDPSKDGVLTCGGYAGAGKSSLLGVLAARWKTDGLLVAYATYTGRAASVLQRKLRASGVETTSTPYTREDVEAIGRRGGLPLCSTIHALLYRPIIDQRTEEIRGWEKRTTLDRDYALIVTDESSMISDEILQDIARHGAPLLAVGDHGQLPPVMARGDLMQNPDLRLEKIHRQAEGNPIIALSKHIREGGRFSNYKGPTGDAIRFVTKNKLADVAREVFAGDLLSTGLLCWTNRTRVALNRQTRELLGHKGLPRAGEPVMCLRNKPPVYNGMRGLLTKDVTVDGRDPWILHASVVFPDEGIPELAYRMCAAQFNREKTLATVEELTSLKIRAERMSDAGSLFDFSYAGTGHKFQGSSLRHAVLFVDRPENPDDDEARRWFYTCSTRASERLTVVR